MPQLDSRELMWFRKIEGDPSRYQQVLVNLLSNALKFSNEGQNIQINLKVLQRDEIHHSHRVEQDMRINLTSQIENSIQESIN
jgi:signal transduction histidine kinase